MKYIFILIILVITSETVFSQDSLKKEKDTYNPFTLNLDAAYNYQNCSGIEFGINTMVYSHTLHICMDDYKQLMEFGVHASCEYNFIHSGNVFGPKIGVGMNHMLRKGFGYSCRLNLTDYDPGRTNDFRFSPQLGLTILGMVNIYYGYNFPLRKNNIPEIGYNKITVNFNIGYKRAIINIIEAGNDGRVW